MVNKNAFGVCPAGPCGSLGITYPAPFETSAVQAVPLKTDKTKADTKTPPKHPFQLQIALKSSLDVFYFMVPCSLHTLISRDPSTQMSKEEFKKFWDMLGADKSFTLEFGGMGA